MRKVGGSRTDLSDIPNNPPSINPEEREQEMISLAVNLAERQLRDGTASPNIICHYLKLATIREQKEQELVEEKIKYMAAKSEMIESAKKSEELFNEALTALSSYRSSDKGE